MLNSSTVYKYPIISKGPAYKIRNKLNKLSNSISISSKKYLISAVYVVYFWVGCLEYKLMEKQFPVKLMNQPDAEYIYFIFYTFMN